MKAPAACAKCGGLAFWNVREMQEHAFFQAKALGEIDCLAPLDTIVCKACGHTVWYSRSTELIERPGSVRRVVDERVRCADCDGQPHLLVALLHEWPSVPLGSAKELAVWPFTGVEERGRFAMLVCDQCGRCEWFAWGLGEGSENGVADPDACVRCRASACRVVAPFREHGSEALPVALVDGRLLGEFAIHFCGACGYTEWYGRRIEGLHADGKYVMHIEGERPAVPAAGGPYR
jgi:predicted nucleic-acid-binding Zn-ribbon protein